MPDRNRDSIGQLVCARQRRRLVHLATIDLPETRGVKPSEVDEGLLGAFGTNTRLRMSPPSDVVQPQPLPGLWFAPIASGNRNCAVGQFLIETMEG
jgi:hypothetical protein